MEVVEVEEGCRCKVVVEVARFQADNRNGGSNSIKFDQLPAPKFNCFKESLGGVLVHRFEGRSRLDTHQGESYKGATLADRKQGRQLEFGLLGRKGLAGPNLWFGELEGEESEAKMVD